MVPSDEPRGSRTRSSGQDSQADAHAPPSPPIRIGRYPVVGELGRGSMGVVYLAEDPTFPRQIAIKILPRGVSAHAESTGRLRKEAALLGTISHQNIATVYSFEEADGRPFLTMEVVEGCTLAERIAAGRLPVDEALHVCRQALAALETAHRKGIVHRDLKPSNIMISRDSTVKVVDFGIAKAVGATHGPSGDSATELEASSGAVGTLGYASPEQLLGEAVDIQADIWAFGCILFECLTGEKAFGGASPEERIAASLHSEPNWTASQGRIPEAIRQILARCLAKEPNDRFQSVAELRRELRAAAREHWWSYEERTALAEPGSGHARDRTATPAPRSKRILRLGIVAVSLFALALAAWHIVRGVALRHVTYEVAGSTITGRAPLLGLVWTRVHDSPVFVHTPTPWNSPQTIAYGLGAGGKDAGRVYVCDLRTGEELWSAAPNLQEIAEVYGPAFAAADAYKCRSLHFADMDGDGTDELMAEYAHHIWSPGFLCIFGHDGKGTDAYYNYGLLYDVVAEDIDHDGKQEVLLAGTLNPSVYRGATVILLDDAHCHGAAVDSLVHPDCPLGDSSLVRLILPHYDQKYMDLLGIERLVAFQLKISHGADRHARVTCFLGSMTDPHVIALDEYLKPRQVNASDLLRVVTRTWPEADRQEFLSREWMESWLARHSLHGALHR